MKKRIFSLFCLLSVVLVFCLTASLSHVALQAGAEDGTASTASTAKPTAKEEPVEDEPKTTTTTTQPTTKESTTKPTESSSSSTNPTSQTNPTNPTNSTNPTDKPSTSEKEEPPATEPVSNQNPTGTTKPTTTKKPGTGKTTTKRYIGTTAPNTTRGHMVIPDVSNTTVAGSTLSPMDAYFERISGMTQAEQSEWTQPEQTVEPEEGGKQLSTPAIVAICLGGFALVVIGLTAAFAIRNKRAAADDADGGEAAEAAYDDPYAQDYAEVEADPAPVDQPASVNETGSFTVVSLDDKDYID